MASYTIKEIIDIVKTRADVKNNIKINKLLFDSRNLISPSDSVFFAVKGKNRDGHSFISDLYNKKLRNFIVSEIPVGNEYSDANFIVVNDTLRALHDIASYHRNNFHGELIAITGSNGKTMVKEWLFHMLYKQKKVIRSPKSYNSCIGVPLSIWLLENNHDIGIIEAGISKSGEMVELYNIIKPDIGIFTNIGDAHQENFNNLNQKISEKLELFKSCKTLIYCKDHMSIHSSISKSNKLKNTKLFTWSSKTNADLIIESLSREKNRTNIKAKYKNKELLISIAFTDEASIENSIHVLAYMLCFGYNTNYIIEQFKELPTVAMRLELKEGINSCTIINDSYNSDIGSLSIALDYLNQQNQHKIKTLVLSDILQSGYKEKDLYREVSKLVKTKKVTRIIGVGNSISSNSNFFPSDSIFYQSTDDFIRNFDSGIFYNQAVLLKGARVFEFERLSNLLEKKSHRTVLEINLTSIIHNLNYYKSLLPEKCRIMAVVKAFSYGTGSFEIANVLQYHGVDYLAVAYIDEGIQLRRTGIKMPILVMNPEAASFYQMIENKLEPEIYSLRILKLFLESVKRNSVKAYPIHIKLNTGMNRLGFIKEDIPEMIKIIKQSGIIKIMSVFSHMAGGGDGKFDDFSHLQIKLFEEMSDQISSFFNYKILLHLLNSQGLESFPDKTYDMLRLGIGLYGIGKAKNSLKNVCTLKTSISQIRNLTNGDTVGYNRMGKINKDSRIAVLPIGYADGLNRTLGNGKGKVLINKQFAPIIGDICMDMLMVDITSINAEEGDDAILFSNDYPVSRLSEQINTIPYEILSSISARVKRIYLTD